MRIEFLPLEPFSREDIDLKLKTEKLNLIKNICLSIFAHGVFFFSSYKLSSALAQKFPTRKLLVMVGDALASHLLYTQTLGPHLEKILVDKDRFNCLGKIQNYFFRVEIDKSEKISSAQFLTEKIETAINAFKHGLGEKFKNLSYLEHKLNSLLVPGIAQICFLSSPYLMRNPPIGLLKTQISTIQEHQLYYFPAQIPHTFYTLEDPINELLQDPTKSAGIASLLIKVNDKIHIFDIPLADLAVSTEQVTQNLIAKINQA